MAFKNFRIETDADGIALVTWDIPGRSMNVLDETTITELEAIVKQTSADGTVIPGPVAINATNGQARTTYPDPFYGVDGTGQVYGFHTGGVNALFVDGSVHFIGQQVSIRTFAALVTRSGGEGIDGGEF